MMRIPGLADVVRTFNIRHWTDIPEQSKQAFRLAESFNVRTLISAYPLLKYAPGRSLMITALPGAPLDPSDYRQLLSVAFRDNCYTVRLRATALAATLTNSNILDLLDELSLCGDERSRADAEAAARSIILSDHQQFVNREEDEPRYWIPTIWHLMRIEPGKLPETCINGNYFFTSYLDCYSNHDFIMSFDSMDSKSS